jgi:RecA/RadA recombinase
LGNAYGKPETTTGGQALKFYIGAVRYSSDSNSGNEGMKEYGISRQSESGQK